MAKKTKSSMRDGEVSTQQATASADSATRNNGSSVRHTPGPWHVSHLHRNIEIESHQDGVVCTLDARSGRVTAVDTEANARLIAAAPELVACLRRMCGMYGAYSHRLAPLLAEDDGTIWTFERANGLALEAIAKATAEAL